MNLLDGEKPKYFYNECANIVKNEIRKLPDNEFKDKIIKIKIDRTLMKLPVMTIPYNININGLSEAVAEKFKRFTVNKKLYFEIPNDLLREEFQNSGIKIILNGSEMGKLGSLFYKTIKKSIPPLNKIIEYLYHMIDIYKMFNIPLDWITPAGMKISLSNRKFNSKKIFAPLL